MQAGVGAIRLSTPKHIASGVGARELADPADCAREMADAAECDGDACIVGARVSVEMLLIALALECLMPCMSLSLEFFKRMSGGASDAEHALDTRWRWRGWW